MWQRKRNFKRETESLQTGTQNNAIKTNNTKARIDKTQQNNRFTLCGDGDETINHIISEWSKFSPKEYKTRHDWLGKIIGWELCKTFNHTKIWFMHNPPSILENETHNLLWDFDIQTDNQIKVIRPDLVINNKKQRICKIVYLRVQADLRVK